MPFLFQTLLLCSCSGIAIALTILGIYCDPHLRLQSWYVHRLWPGKKYNYKDKNIRDRLEIQDNYTLYNNTVSYVNDSAKPWFRVSGKEHNNNTVDNYWSVKFEDSKEKEEIKIWLPVLVLSVVLFLYNIGLGSVPYVLITELFSVNVSIKLFNLVKRIPTSSPYFFFSYSNPIKFALFCHHQAIVS